MHIQEQICTIVQNHENRLECGPCSPKSVGRPFSPSSAARAASRWLDLAKRFAVSEQHAAIFAPSRPADSCRRRTEARWHWTSGASIGKRERKSTPQPRRGFGVAAAALVSPREALILDAGLTVLELAKSLRVRPLSVLTNSLDVAQQLDRDDQVSLTLTGGQWDGRDRFLGGEHAPRDAGRSPGDWCPRACAVHPEAGMTARHAADASMKRAMLRAGLRPVLLVDHKRVRRGRAAFRRTHHRASRDRHRQDHEVARQGGPSHHRGLSAGRRRLCRRQRAARELCGGQRVREQHRDRHRADAAGDRRDRGRRARPRRRTRRRPAACPRRPVDADVDHDRARLDPVAADHLGAPDGGDHQVGARDDGRQIARAASGRPSRSRRRRAAAPPSACRPCSNARRRPRCAPASGSPASLDQLHHAERRAGDEARLAHAAAGRRSRGECRRRPCADRPRTARDARRCRPGAAAGSGCRPRRGSALSVATSASSSRVGRRRGQPVIERLDAGLRARRRLVAHVDLRRGIVADQHDGETGRARRPAPGARPRRVSSARTRAASALPSRIFAAMAMRYITTSTDDFRRASSGCRPRAKRADGAQAARPRRGHARLLCQDGMIRRSRCS